MPTIVLPRQQPCRARNNNGCCASVPRHSSHHESSRRAKRFQLHCGGQWHYSGRTGTIGNRATIDKLLNAFTTGNPYFSTNLLEVSIGRDLGSEGVSRVPVILRNFTGRTEISGTIQP